METTKIAIGLTAICMFTNIAFASKPDIAKYNRVYLGLGVALESTGYQWTYDSTDLNVIRHNNVLPGSVAPSVSLGYTLLAKSRYAFGLYGEFNYDNTTSQEYATGSTAVSSTAFMRSHVNAVLFAGVRLSPLNMLYIAGGYSAAWTKLQTSFQFSSNKNSIGNKKIMLNGGIMKAGWRYYFQRHAFLDINYGYTLYADNLGKATATSKSLGEEASSEGFKRASISSFSATFNYMFNI